MQKHKITVVDEKVTNLHLTHWYPTSNITELEFVDCEFDLEAGTLRTFTALEKMSFYGCSGNPIIDIGVQPWLHTVVLGHCNFTSMNLQTEVNETLTTVMITNCHCVEKVFLPTSVNHLLVDNCPNVETMFRTEYERITFLMLSRCNITDFDFSKTPNLEYLSLHTMSYHGEVPDFSGLEKLEVLDVRNLQTNWEKVAPSGILVPPSVTKIIETPWANHRYPTVGGRDNADEKCVQLLCSGPVNDDILPEAVRALGKVKGYKAK